MAVDNMTKAVGVENLIDRLKTDGVSKGKTEAESIVADAKRQAMSILDAARREADGIVTAAQRESERVRQTATQALQLAGRDALLKLRESFQLQFENRLRKLVGVELQNADTLSQMILAVAGKTRPDEADAVIEVLVPIDPSQPDALTDYVAGLTSEMLRPGVTFGVGEDVTAGVRIKLVDKNVEIDLSDEALASFLGRFLVPRFRQIMDFKS